MTMVQQLVEVSEVVTQLRFHHLGMPQHEPQFCHSPISGFGSMTALAAANPIKDLSQWLLQCTKNHLC
jgi:hypothetical protein